MAAAVISPQPWQSMHHATHTPSLSWQPQMQPYGPSTLLNDYSQSLATPSMAISQPISQSQQHHQQQHQHQQHQHQPVPQQPQQQQPQQDRRASQSHSSQNTDGGPWTAEMDNTLIDAQARGMRWEQISQVYFPHKSANACRKRYGRAKEERRATDWDEVRIGRVIAIYNREGFRERLWNALANEAGERWQDIEKLCYSQGLSRMARGRGSHSRSRSRASVGHTVPDDYDHRYHSNEEYDSRDDSGIGLGLITEHTHAHTIPHSHAHGHPHAHHMSQSSSQSIGAPPITSGAPIEMLIQPSHGYAYAT